MDNQRDKEPPKPERKDRRVLSVPAGKTYVLMTKHNVYSCPVSHPKHDEKVDVFAPRNEEGKIPRIYRIVARIVADPRNPVCPTHLKPEYSQNIKVYISVAKSIKGILDGGGQYRFYILSDIERYALKHAPSLSHPGNAHVYLSLKQLVNGAEFVDPL
jgi:hypothetical protein